MTRSLTLELPDDVADEIAQANDPAAYVVVAVHQFRARHVANAAWCADPRFSEENIAEFDREFERRTQECRERMQDPIVRADLAVRLVKLRTGQWP